MAEPGISSGAQSEVRLSNAWLEANAANQQAVADCQKLTSNPAGAFEHTDIPRMGQSGGFNPRGIHIGSTRVAGADPDDTSTYAHVNRRLVNNQHFYQTKYNTGILHPDWVAQITAYRTTARDITIKA